MCCRTAVLILDDIRCSSISNTTPWSSDIVFHLILLLHLLVCSSLVVCVAQVFQSVHASMTDLAVPAWATDAQDFVNIHRRGCSSHRMLNSVLPLGSADNGVLPEHMCKHVANS